MKMNSILVNSLYPNVSKTLINKCATFAQFLRIVSSQGHRVSGSRASKAVLLMWIVYVFTVLCLLCLCGRLFICALWSHAGKGLTSWLSFVVSNCEFVTFLLVSWVRCGT